MNDVIIVALIGFLGTVISVFASAKVTQDKVTSELHTQNEVQNTKIEHLTQEIKKLNDFSNRIPKIEGDIKLLEEKISVANHRIADLEKTNIRTTD